jgi:hypothetical protein
MGYKNEGFSGVHHILHILQKEMSKGIGKAVLVLNSLGTTP